ncbi:NAD(P)H-dependent oxidoreductase [Pendulispora rubella]|uniref:NAD(P)H-dependent oxidoreductase n=1 Tax=Pendulispora rubella TaxID=2741070 RepID=A0ABZ2KRC2_9BACT
MNDSTLSIGVILGSVREGRKGEPIARWVMDLLGTRSDVAPELLDLRDFDPSFGQRWPERITAHDAFVIVTPEYNHGYPGTLKNALDALYGPWNDKPVAFVSYGFSASGARAIEQLRQVTSELRMMPIRDEVNLRLGAFRTDHRGFPDDERARERAGDVMTELLFWGHLLKEGRSRRPARS